MHVVSVSLDDPYEVGILGLCRFALEESGNKNIFYFYTVVRFKIVACEPYLFRLRHQLSKNVGSGSRTGKILRNCFTWSQRMIGSLLGSACEGKNQK